MNDLVIKDQAIPVVQTTPSPATDLVSIISIMAQNPATMNPDVVNKMLDAQERIMAKQGEIEFNQAMARLQPKLPAIFKASKAHTSAYAKYEDIDKIIRPLYSAEGFSLSFNSKHNGQTVTYYGTISHSAGHSKTAEMVLPADTSGSKNAIQAIGSTVSYARRYLVSMLLNIVFTDEDDDGHAGGAVYVDAAELAEIRSWIERTGSDEKKFCGFMKVERLDDILSKDYNRAITALKAKLK